MINIQIPIPDKKSLRNFGLVMGGILAGLFGILFPLAFSHAFPRWPWLVAAGLWSWALLLPNSLKFVYYVWMLLGQILGWINTRIVLGIVFYLMITPIGLSKRLFGNNPLDVPPTVPNSYRHPIKPRPPKHMEYPF